MVFLRKKYPEHKIITRETRLTISGGGSIPPVSVFYPPAGLRRRGESMNINDLIIDVNMQDTSESFYDAYEALEDGYDKSRPIVIDEAGFILDGNHRYIVFRDAGRLDEISIIMIDGWDAQMQYNRETAKHEFLGDDIYFPIVKKIGKWIQK